MGGEREWRHPRVLWWQGMASVAAKSTRGPRRVVEDIKFHGVEKLK